jgi:hypothetical protein
MTTTAVRPSVLILGRSQLVLDEAVAGLRELGYTAQATNDFGDITGRFDVRQVDLVVFGGQVPAQRKDELTSEISAIHPPVIFVQGLAGIPGLIIAQVRGVFTARYQDNGSTPSFDPAQRAIQLTLAQPAHVTVTAWWGTSFVPPDPKSESLVLLDRRLAAGRHTVPWPGMIPDHAAFAAVEADQAIYTFPVATR